MSSPIVFTDTETTGLSLEDDIWEFAAIRREPDDSETEYHLFIEHDRARCARLPQSFREDHYNRYRDHRAYSQASAAEYIANVVFHRAPGNDLPHIVGAVPAFDATRIEILLNRYGYGRPWHHHLIDVEAMSLGYLYGVYRHVNTLPVTALPWISDELASVCGVESASDDERHTAMGDARWVKRWYDKMTGYNGLPSH